MESEDALKGIRVKALKSELGRQSMGKQKSSNTLVANQRAQKWSRANIGPPHLIYWPWYWLPISSKQCDNTIGIGSWRRYLIAKYCISKELIILVKDGEECEQQRPKVAWTLSCNLYRNIIRRLIQHCQKIQNQPIQNGFSK